MPLAEQLKVSVNIGLIEDEPEMLENIQHKMKESLGAFGEICLNSRLGKGKSSPITIEAILKCTDNMVVARELIHTGNCDLALADYKIKESQNSPKGTASVLPLFEEIRKKKGFFPVIGHTAYLDQLEAAKEKKLALETISKTLAGSVVKLVEKGTELSRKVGIYKGNLFGFFAKLKEASQLPSPIDKQEAIKCARDLLADLQPPDYASFDYQKAVIVLRSLIFRISSIPSEKFMLRETSIQLIELLGPLIQNLGRPFFSYERHAIPVLTKLEAVGYNVIMRIEDE